MNKELSDFVKVNYPKSKADLMACFMGAGLKMLESKGFLGMINQHSWMFLSSYEKLRETLIKETLFDTLLHLGPRTFPEIGGEVVQNACFTFWNTKADENGKYIRLVDDGSSELKRSKTLEAIQNPNCGYFYTANQKDFEKIPGSPIGYWLSEQSLKSFEKFDSLSEVCNTKKGLATSDNNRFLRLWYEPMYCMTSLLNLDNSGYKWYPHHKGGARRKWFGNHEYVINWADNGFEIRNFKDSHGKLKSRPQNLNYSFKQAVTWSKITSGDFSSRICYGGFLFDDAAAICHNENSIILVKVNSFLNSKVSQKLLNAINPTLNIQIGDIGGLPVSLDSSLEEPNKNIKISKLEWDSREASWDFQQNELLRLNGEMVDGDWWMENDETLDNKTTHQLPTIEETYDLYQQYWKNKFYQLHKNEEELNRQFIEIYGLQEELTPDVPLKDITILKEETSIVNNELVFDAKEVFAQFVSYAVGCMFGRYSLDKEGLILANQGETISDFVAKVQSSRFNVKNVSDLSFIPDDDNIIPILDDEWFEDDIVGRFYEFLKVTFGKENFEKNLAFVEDSLGKDIRKFFVKDFYTDHIKRYKKRPIYWMFSSPKGSFNVLIYLHRYTPDTLNQILNGYLKEYREKLSTRLEHLDHLIETGSSSEQTKAAKEKDKLKLVLLELREYERDILYPLATERISIDLDDGVLVNYNKFGKAIKEVKGLNDKKTKEKVRGFDWIDTTKIK